MKSPTPRPQPDQAPAPGADSPSVTAPAAVPAGTPFPGASAEARRLAAAILEVLAGTQGPAEAARMLGISLARYYQLEQRGMAGLVGACVARRRGHGRLWHSLPGQGIENNRVRCST